VPTLGDDRHLHPDIAESIALVAAGALPRCRARLSGPGRRRAPADGAPWPFDPAAGTGGGACL
jgi:hypothetical protein